MKFEDVKVGMKIRFPGNSVIGACTGTVEKIYPPDTQEDDPGAVTMHPDPLPQKWPYLQCEVFAPHIDEIEPA